MPRNYFHQVWGPVIAEKVSAFFDMWENFLQRDLTLFTLVNLYMVFDNEDSFYRDDEEFKTHCQRNLVTLRHYIHAHCLKENKTDVFTNGMIRTNFKPLFVFKYFFVSSFQLWILYPSIADVRTFVGSEFVKQIKCQNANEQFPYLCEVINGWWKYSLDEEILKITVQDKSKE